MSTLAIVLGVVGVIVIVFVIVGLARATPREKVDVKRDATESQGEELSRVDA